MRGQSAFASRVAFVGALITSSMAVAQTGSPDGATTGSQGGVEDIIVTAQRRAENLQTVPIAVSAISASTSQALGITDTASLSVSVPGLDFGRSSNAGVPYIRGIGNNNSSVGEESAVAVYVDGVYVPSLVGNFFELNNIERVEVLKGPQGTLFGRNATGGVVQVITRDPSQTPALDAKVGYGNYDTFEGGLYGTAGVSENLAGDIAAYYSRRADGLGKNLTTGLDAYRARALSLRSKWKLTLPNTDVIFAIDYSRRDDEPGTANRTVAGTALDGGGVRGGYYDVISDATSFGRVKDGGASLTIKQDMDWARLVSISAYRKTTAHLVVDADYTSLPIVKADIHSRQRTFTQEFQLLSPDSSKLQWILGFYYFNSNAAYRPFTITGFGVAPATFVIYDVEQRTRSYAGFGQVTYPVTDSLRLTGGLRYTSDRRALSGATITDFGAAPVKAKTTFNKWTYRGSVDYDLADRTLLYASYSRGFKSGLYNTLTPTEPVVRPEVLDAAEVGIKTDLFDNILRVNISGFDYRFKDIQLQRTIATTTVLQNAARAKVRGAEVEIDFVPTQNLRFRGGIAYLHTRFKEFNNGPITTPGPNGNLLSTGNLAGRQLPRAPKFTANIGIVYTVPTEVGKFTAAGNYYYNDGYFWEPENRLAQQSYNIVNASLEWEAPSEKWGIRLWAKNLTNEKYLSFGLSSQVGDDGAPADPRTYGVTLFAHAF